MKNVVTKKLPHGMIPFSQVHDATLRDTLMKLNENIQSLDKRLAAVETAIRELQRRA